jgi:hypothetical protein
LTIKIHLQMKTLPFFIVFALLALTHLACNPECESLQAVRVSSDATPAGYEILITAVPLDGLRNKKVSFGNIIAESVFHENFGLVAKVPEGVNGDLELRIEDPDCLDFIRIPFKVADESYFQNNLNYVPPMPPFIVIPTVNINPPQFVNNAWLCPENPDYCLWFQMVEDADGKETKHINPTESAEQATCPCLRSSDLPFAQNRIFGIVDKENNYIEITIDRTHINGGYEKFTGGFIDFNQVEGYSIGWDTTVTCFNVCQFPAGVNTGTEGHMMLLTSQKTGRQLSVYQKKP